MGDILIFQAHPEFTEGYARTLTMRREIFGGTYRAAIDSLPQTDNLQVARHILILLHATNKSDKLISTVYHHRSLPGAASCAQENNH